MPLYFPRSEAEEESARWQLPADVGGCYGEPVMPDREIRIIDNPQHTFHRKFHFNRNSLNIKCSYGVYVK